MQKRQIIVTSALPYANGDIHVGHLVEYLQTDFWVRFQKMRGHRCLYVCADDTHGTPIMIRARQEGIAPEDLIAASYDRHVRDFADFQIEFDNFYTTHSEENRELCNRVFAGMEQAGALFIRPVPQLWCPNDKMFLPDRFVRGVCPNCHSEGQYGDSCDACGATYSPADMQAPQCALCGTPPETRESEHIFFKLQQYKEFLRDWLPRHVARDVANKLLEWFGDEAELRPWDISRDAPYFGFEIPGHPGKYFYVWLDAPIGYMASLKNWCGKHQEDFDALWNGAGTEIYHFIGKDIVRFHCLFWPAMLHAAGFKGPNQVFVHGFLTVNGEKMSKSKGTFIKARTYLDSLDPGALRYYYACKLNHTTDDIDLNLDDFTRRVNGDLVGKITNLASRGAQMIHKRLDGRLGTMDARGRELLGEFLARADDVAACYENRRFSQVPVIVCKLADAANEYFDQARPWESIKQTPEETRQVLTSILNLFRVLAIYLQPVLPRYAAQVAELFGEPAYDWKSLKIPMENRPIAPYRYLAQRLEEKQVQDMLKQSANSLPGGAPAQATPSASTPPVRDTIDIDTFGKVDLRVARVVTAAYVEGADKLLRLELDIGEANPRQVFAGIRKVYDPATLVGRHVVMIANLAPRKMRFGLSEGMILAAGNPDGGLFLISPDEGALPGATVK